MAQYSVAERSIAKLLESQPWLRDIIRFLYKRFVYFMNRPKSMIRLTFNVDIVDVADLCNIRNYDAFFFGYYDKSPWDNTDENYLGHLLLNNTCSVVLCDLKNKSHEVIGTTNAWNYQQGAMAQWCNGFQDVIYNDYDGNILGARIWNRKTRLTRFIKYPIQVVHPKHNEYLSLNYRRLAKLRPDYGYFTECENFETDQSYNQDGIWRIDLETGKSDLIIKISDLIKGTDIKFHSSNHKVNHCYYSPSGLHFVFLHRWLDVTGKYSRLICSDAEGKKLKVILDQRMVSHYSWINDEELIVWGRTEKYGDSYIILNAISGEYSKLDEGDLTRYGDGHPTVDLSGKTIVTDTYPDKSRMRSLILFDRDSGQKRELGKFFAPWNFEAEKRCDLHPRWNKESNIISVDSAHEGIRKNYHIHLS